MDGNPADDGPLATSPVLRALGLEERVLLRLAVAGGPALSAASCLGAAIDAERLVSLSLAHGLGEILATWIAREAASEAALVVPLEAARPARLALAIVADAQQRVLEELGATLDAIDARGVVVKGAALARTVYERPSLRPATDIDLVVGGGFDRVVQALRGADWIAEGRSLRRPRWWAPPARNLSLRGPRGVALDLHEALSDSPIRPVLERQPVWREGSALVAGVSSLRAPNPIHHAIHVAEHALRSRWVRFAWLGDLARLTRQPAFDAGRAIALARRLGARRSLDVGMSLVAAVSEGRTRPDGWWPSDDARRIADEVVASWRVGYRGRSVHRHDGRWTRLCRERASDPWRAGIDRVARGIVRRWPRFGMGRSGRDADSRR